VFGPQNLHAARLRHVLVRDESQYPTEPTFGVAEAFFRGNRLPSKPRLPIPIISTPASHPTWLASSPSPVSGCQRVRSGAQAPCSLGEGGSGDGLQDVVGQRYGRGLQVGKVGGRRGAAQLDDHGVVAPSGRLLGFEEPQMVHLRRSCRGPWTDFLGGSLLRRWRECIP